jgi:hypothetical protein
MNATDVKIEFVHWPKAKSGAYICLLSQVIYLLGLSGFDLFNPFLFRTLPLDLEISAAFEQN